MNDRSLKSTRDLRLSERRFLAAMQELDHGRFESVRIRHGELLLDPWPISVRKVKFGTAGSGVAKRERPAHFDLKKHLADFFEFVRGVENGEIKTLHVFDGFPVDMDIAEQGI